LSRILVTGADGFVGKALVDFLRNTGESVVAVTRGAEPIPGVRVLKVPDIRTAVWDGVLQGVDCVIHLAARAHVLREHNPDPLGEFRAVNVRPTIDLFRASQAAHVERFIFVSSIGVNGNFTSAGAFTETDTPRPAEPYAVSKWEAEQSLRGHLRPHATRLIVVRPSLIYGAYAKGNFLRLLRLIDAGWPLPFGALGAKRTFLGLTSFCDLLKKCASIHVEREQLFVAGDDRPVSTSELVGAMAAAMHIRSRQPRVPVKLLSILARALNRRAEFDRLSKPLEVDASRARTSLGWTSPALSADLQKMVDVYLQTKK
jgi:nucleoside-diphosphate-sugar epimerase